MTSDAASNLTGDGPSEATLRDEARSWYEANWDPDLTVGEWFRRMMEDRWAYPSWPEAWCPGRPSPLMPPPR